MSPPSDASPPPASDPPRASSRFWVRWGMATVVLGVLAVYGAFLEGGPSPIQEGTEPDGASADAEHDPDGRTPSDEQDRDQPEDVEVEGEVEPAPEDHATPDASATPQVAFDTISYAGSGSDRLELEVPDDQPAIMDLRHDGTMSFAVEVRDAAGATDLVVAATGGYEGTRTVNLGEVVENYRELDIRADGNWMIAIRPLSAATRAEDGGVAGRGDDVVLIDGGGDGWFTHDGRAEVMVEEYRGPELFAGLVIVDEVGAYDGDIRITEDTEVLAITADGAWELSID